jgi:tRNA(His) 5'-end guanylyltransferase
MKDDLGNRMKKNYENRTRYFLPRRTNTIIRIDGEAFHTFTRGFDKPFDYILMSAMDNTTKSLCGEIQGCVMGYCQSDEISLLLTDFDKPTTDAWFDGNIQKIVSVSASMATGFFNDHLRSASDLNYGDPFALTDKTAFFDARVFTIPDNDEVINYFIWRQKDAVRNSISMVAQSLYSRGRMIIKDVAYKPLKEEIGAKLMEDGDDRVIYNENKGYSIAAHDWTIKPAIDFSKNFSSLHQYIQFGVNLNMI